MAHKTSASKQQSRQRNAVVTSHLWFQITPDDIPSIVSGNLLKRNRSGEV